VELTPFILFDGACAEAMEFYQTCLGGELQLTRMGDTPMGAQARRDQLGKVVFAHLQSGALEISATDWLHPTRRPSPGNTVALYLTGSGYDELQGPFERLAVGADTDLLDQLRQEPFGIYGHLADRYGVHWFFRADAAGPPAA
jgi:PhnB protein